MSRVMVVVVVAGCLHGSEPTVDTPVQPPVTSASEAAADGPRTDEEDLRDPVVLARALRTKQSTGLVHAGPIVIADNPTASIHTVCDDSAVFAQETWLLMLREPTRADPVCREARRNIVCGQKGLPLLVVTFTKEPHVRIVGGVVGGPSASGGLSPQQITEAFRNAKCPSTRHRASLEGT